ncbi:hypothetical protein J1614_009966 [Plenodomus biglobosus]|nr:hypothetical protein J1614_009966 [Plenodomus biglobosus]
MSAPKPKVHRIISYNLHFPKSPSVPTANKSLVLGQQDEKIRPEPVTCPPDLPQLCGSREIRKGTKVVSKKVCKYKAALAAPPVPIIYR